MSEHTRPSFLAGILTWLDRNRTCTVLRPPEGGPTTAPLFHREPGSLHRSLRMLVLCMTFGLSLAAGPAGKAQTLTTLYSFCAQNNCADGQIPYTVLVQGRDGNFYGTTIEGGAYSEGTVYKITPGGTLTTLYSFCADFNDSSCLDGQSPDGNLVPGSDGNFYGTTYGGGANSSGTIFRITPRGSLTTLYSFCAQSDCTDGSYPYAGLIQASNGNFYGTTYGGGTNGSGTVFRLTPSGDLTTLYSFCSQINCGDGEYPYAGLIQGNDGNFYGTTEYGGVRNHGTVFRLTPSGDLTTLYSFCSQVNCGDGEYPVAGLIQASNGNLYGTTHEGGVTLSGGGTIFKITPSGALTTVYSFCSQAYCTDGHFPYAGLSQGSDGNFYGTTYSGGANFSGSIFKITPTGALTTVYSFCAQDNCPDGNDPVAGLTQGSDGNFYGTTEDGGANQGGTVFRLAVFPFAVLAPTSLAFSQQAVNTPSAMQSVIVSNTGTGSMTVSSIAITGDDFSQTDDCINSLAAGEGCAINVTFSPTGTGLTAATLTVADNSSGVAGSTQTLSLSGTGFEPVVSEPGPPVVLPPPDNPEPPQPPVTSPEPGQPAAPGPSASPFGVGPGRQVHSPMSPLVATSPSATTSAPAVRFSSSSLLFFGQTVGSSSSAQVIKLSNPGDAPIPISSITASGDFQQTNDCGSSLEAGAQCTISVTFKPGTAGEKTGTLTITRKDAGPQGSTQTVSLSGTGTEPMVHPPAGKAAQE